MQTTRKCVFLTLEDRAPFVFYDHLTFEPLRSLGWDVVEIPWDRPDMDWGPFDVVVIRSTWDYQNQPQQFLDVLSAIEDSGTRLLNPLSICRWNLDKTYLCDLEQRGIGIIPTEWPTGLDEDTLRTAFDRFDSPGLVVKPTVGANADDTFALTRLEPAAWQNAIDVFTDRPLMIQPFIRSIVDEGEFSLFYFGGEYSHTVLKTPKPNDFRVQEEHGGSLQTVSPEAAFTEAGQQVIDSIEDPLLYARVDLVRLENGQPALIELELIEPSLYFSFDEQSPARFAKALDRMMG